MSVYGLPLICKQAVSGNHGTTAYVYSASKVGIHTLMPGHNGLFARQRPIALSYFTYVEREACPRGTLPGLADAGLTCLPSFSLL